MAEFKDELAMILGGYVVEKMIYGEEMISTGPSSDLRQATKVAKDMVTRFGMSPLGPRTFGEHEELIFLGKEIHERQDYSEKTAEMIDKEVELLFTEALARAKKTVEENREKLDKMVGVLMEKETIEQDEIKEIMK
jgi:cell division protease FtsH